MSMYYQRVEIGPDIAKPGVIKLYGFPVEVDDQDTKRLDWLEENTDEAAAIIREAFGPIRAAIDAAMRKEAT